MNVRNAGVGFAIFTGNYNGLHWQVKRQDE